MSSVDHLVTCPYESSHRIIKSRMQFHLVKCRKNHPCSKVRCCYDATHDIDQMAYEHHIAECPSSGNVKSYKYCLESPKQVGTVPLEEACAKTTNICDEDWSGGNPTYNPEAAIENKNIVRMQIGLSKAKRKQFRNAERMRIASLKESSSDENTTYQEPVFEKPLRAPKNAAKALAAANSLENIENDSVNSLVSQFQKVSTKENDQTKETNSSPTQKLSNILQAPSNIDHKIPTKKSNLEEEQNNSSGTDSNEQKETALRNIHPNLKTVRKITTGRGFTIAYETLKSEVLGRKENLENCSSVYGYGEEEEAELDFNDVELKKEK